MMVPTLLLCDSAQSQVGKLYILGGGWNLLRFPTYPAGLPVGIAIAIDVGWNETNAKHHLVVRFADADGNPIGPRIEADFNQGRPPDATPGEDLRLVMAMNAPLEISGPGTYAAVAEIDGTEMARTRFQALKVPGQE